MDYLLHLAVIVGAVAVYLLMPRRRGLGRGLGAFAAVVSGASLVGYLATRTAAAQPGVYFYLFLIIASAAGIAVITHPRPVYSALYFVLVVLASSGMFLLLAAEFMVVAMIIIYAGAILVTYLFVIMLATLPQSSHEAEGAPVYDRVAREPLPAVALGFVLLAVMGGIVYSPDMPDTPRRHIAPTDLEIAIKDAPREVMRVLRTRKIGEEGTTVVDPGLNLDAVSYAWRDHDALVVTLPDDGGEITLDALPDGDLRIEAAGFSMTAPSDHELVRAIRGQVTNVDRVGVTLFEGHTLGVELAGIVLLLAMVGAIVIARKRLPEPTPTAS